jgi:hypothetical protein
MEENENIDYYNVGESSFVVTVMFSGGYRKGNAVRCARVRWVEVNRYSFDGIIFNTPHLCDMGDPDPDHCINESRFELIAKREEVE